MANVIKCPKCGENNLPDQEFCQYCQARLVPLTGNLRGEDKPLTPGQLPTKKTTADLEPVLPQWLRDARNLARQTPEEDAPKPQVPQVPQAPQKPPSTFSSDDFLAGLQSQAQDDEEELPDWLTSITGETPKTKKPQTESPDVRWVELGDTKDFPQPEPESDMPSWLSGITAQSAPQADDKDEFTDWLRDADASQQPQQPSQSFSFDKPPAASETGETSDWLHSMVTGDSTGFNDSANAGDEPFTPSDTPDWLRAMDAENTAQKAVTPSDASDTPPAFSDTPDWLRAMDAGNAAPSASEPASSSDTPDWLRAMDAGNAAPSASEPASSSDTPDWLRAMDAGNAAPSASEPASSSDTPDWLRAMDAGNAAPSASEPASSSDTPDWLRAMDAGNATPSASEPASSSDTPDWLRAMDAGSAAPSASEPASSSDTPDWLRAMGAESAAPSASTPPSSSDLSSWLNTIDEQEKTQSADSASFSGSGLGETNAGVSSASDTPDWLKGLDSGTPSSDQDWLKSFESAESEQPAQAATPAWLNDLDAPVKKSGQEPAAKDDSESDIPSWLKAATPQSSIFAEPSAAQEESAPASSSSDMPDWLNAFKSTDAPEPQATLPLSKDKPAETVLPAFMRDAQPSTDADSLFTEMPDWLSIVDETAPPESMPAPITNVDAIAPGDLPSWVQAMRPVDTGVPQSSTSLSGDKTAEARGALAGIQGVLPVGKGFLPTSRPKSYSIKLQASEEQQAHAALLEQILSAETSPVPVDSFATIGTSRGLRWVLTFLLFAILTVVLSLRTQIFALPSSLLVPVEFGGALQVTQSIPEAAPVLVVFDYEPARAGEIEAAAVPMFDQMILLRHPRLTFISMNETGSVLAERFISSGPLAGHKYQSGVQYLNLGYLPGGQMGIRAFAEKPSETAKYTIPQSSNLVDFAPTSAWALPPLEGVTSLSQFAAWILITDDADSARTWIEQTSSARANVPFVVISSAQAAPMIQPYYASKQINGLVSGLYGGALFEQNNSGRPGTARAYWDAYSIGMLLAMALILGGGLLNLALGLRDRAAAREAK